MMSGFWPLLVRHVCEEPSGMTTDSPSLLGPDATSMQRQILQQTWRKIEIRTQNEGKPPIPREKTHVLHQIGIDIAAEANRVLEIRCEQQNLPAHDAYDPPCQS